MKNMRRFNCPPFQLAHSNPNRQVGGPRFSSLIFRENLLRDNCHQNPQNGSIAKATIHEPTFPGCIRAKWRSHKVPKNESCPANDLSGFTRVNSSLPHFLVEIPLGSLHVLCRFLDSYTVTVCPKTFFQERSSEDMPDMHTKDDSRTPDLKNTSFGSFVVACARLTFTQLSFLKDIRGKCKHCTDFLIAELSTLKSHRLCKCLNLRFVK